MEGALLAQLAGILVLAIAGQWLAERLRLPSILVLLLVGVAAGPGLGLLEPDRVFGDALPAVVSLAVAIILFEGALSLRLADVREVQAVVTRLVSVGAAATWAVGAVAAHLVLGLSWAMAVLLGAILIVSGPTVVVPLLRQVRPGGRLASVLRWEAIFIDPVGAVASVLAFEAVLGRRAEESAAVVARGLGETVLAGVLLGAVGAGLLVWLLRRFLVPTHLEVPVALALVVAVHLGANVVQPEAGLVAATLMGVGAANQRQVPVQHIASFGRHVGVLLTSSLFVVLAARMRVADFAVLDWRIVVFVAVLVLVARPLAVMISTVRSRLGRAERLYLAAMAPRGIVAASVASVFALFLRARFDEAPLLLPYTFAVILMTVAVYGLLALPLARRLGVADPDPQGLIVVGAHDWARQLAHVVGRLGLPVLLVPSNHAELRAARDEGLAIHADQFVSEDMGDEVGPEGVGRVLALSRNEQLNSLAAMRFSEVFGRANVYQLAPDEERDVHGEVTGAMRGRRLFADDLSVSVLDQQVAAGARVELVDLAAPGVQRAIDAGRVRPLLVQSPGGGLEIVRAGVPLDVTSGRAVALVTQPDRVDRASYLEEASS